MELDEIEKKLAEFEKKLTPVAKGETTLKAAPQPPSQPPEAVPAAAPGEMCLSNCFKEVIQHLPPSWIGENVNELLDIIDVSPLCEVKS